MGTDHRWVLVLAGGSGTRLARMTSTTAGTCVPKQYCSVDGERSLLQRTVARALRLVSRERIAVVVARQHELFWRREFDDLERPLVVVQPDNRGTAAGVLLPLLSILERTPGAQVTLMPSDHFVADEAALARELGRAQARVAQAPDRLQLIGIEPDQPVGDYGWILPGPGTGATRTVAAFVEKPGLQGAIELMARGAVWNALLLVASGRTLLDLYRRRLPGLLAAFADPTALRSAATLEQLYASLPAADFSRDLLQGSEDCLELRIASRCGWTDLGTPERLRACLSRLPHAAVHAGHPTQLLLARATRALEGHLDGRQRHAN